MLPCGPPAILILCQGGVSLSFVFVFVFASHPDFISRNFFPPESARGNRAVLDAAVILLLSDAMVELLSHHHHHHHHHHHCPHYHHHHLMQWLNC